MSFASFLQRTALLSVFVVFVAGVSRTDAQDSPPSTQVTAETHLGRGYDALKNEHYDTAASEFKAALALDPTLVERARFPLAVALFEMHESAEARREFQSLRRDLGDHPNVLYYLGRLELEDGNYKAAAQDLSQAVVKPPFPDTTYYLGVAFLKQRDLDDAEKWLKTAAQLLPQDSRVEYQLSRVYREQGRDEEAKQALANSAEKRKQEDSDTRLRQKCTQRLDQGLREEARVTCEKLYDPDNSDKLTRLGTIYGQHHDLDDALRCFRRAAELQSQSPQMQYNLALTYYQLNQFTEARLPLERALKRWPDLFQLTALYGAVMMKLGEDSSAYQALRHAHELNPQDPGTVEMLYATILQLAQKSEEARDYSHSLAYLQEAAKLQPGQPEPHRRMAEIYSLTARTGQAAAERREADRLNKSSPN